MVIITTLLKH